MAFIFRDKLGQEIAIGSRIAYAVRDGSCGAAMRTAEVVGLKQEKRGSEPESKIIVRVDRDGQGRRFRYSNRVALSYMSNGQFSRVLVLRLPALLQQAS
jgi:hypothetical protein